MAAIETPWMNSMSSAIAPKDGDASQPGGEPPTVAAFTPVSSSSLASYSFPRQRSTILVHQKSPLLLATPPQITRALAYSHPFILPLNNIAGLLSWTTGDPWESFLLLVAFWAATLYGDVLVRWTGPVMFVLLLVFGMYIRRFSPLSSAGLPNEQGVKTHQRKESETKVRHHKSLDEIVEILKLFTSRCNILLDPFLRLTDFLSTQSTATSATTRPALTTLFLRILILTPAWYLLTLGPFHVITTKRVILTFGTITLSWHSRPARISRTILWRSLTVRRTCSAVTGLHFPIPRSSISLAQPFRTGTSPRDANSIAAALALTRHHSKDLSAGTSSKADSGIRFTFTLFENQRRWLGIGWTSSMLAYERAAWTDDQLNATAAKDRFELPDIEGGVAKWQWCADSSWTVEGADIEESTGKGSAPKDAAKGKEVDDAGGWTYYDTGWKFGRMQDGWGRYTRRRKWCRDAELVEADSPSETGNDINNVASTTLTTGPASTSTPASSGRPTSGGRPPNTRTASGFALSPTSPTTRRRAGTATSDDGASVTSATGGGTKLRTWFGGSGGGNSAGGGGSGIQTTHSTHSRTASKGSGSSSLGKTSRSRAKDGNDGGSGAKDGYISGAEDSGSFSFSADNRGVEDEEDGGGYVPLTFRGRQGGVEADWGVGDDVGMALG